MNASILLGYTEAMRRRPQASGLGRGPDHSGEADLVLFLVIQTHSSRRDDASDPFSRRGDSQHGSPENFGRGQLDATPAAIQPRLHWLKRRRFEPA